MNTITLLLVLFVLDGEAHTFAVQAESPAQCILMKENTPSLLTKLIGRKPQAYAASCAEVLPILDAS